jgi:hypothetical protein
MASGVLIDAAAWLLLALAIGLAGGSAGTRAGGRLAAAVLGALVLLRLLDSGAAGRRCVRAGYSAGILTPALYLALVVMALVTTAMTGPAYTLVDLAATRRPTAGPAMESGALP